MAIKLYKSQLEPTAKSSNVENNNTKKIVETRIPHNLMVDDNNKIIEKSKKNRVKQDKMLTHTS